MRSSIQRLISATLLSCALVAPQLAALAQDVQGQKPATRPRRANAPEWPTTTNADQPAPLPEIEPEPVHLTNEPVIRIGLATGARSVTVSTTASTLNATDPAEQPLPLEVARVRIEPRAYPLLPQSVPDSEKVVETASASAKTSGTPNANPKTVTPAANTNAKSGMNAASAQGTRRANSSSEEAAGGVRLTSRAAAPMRGETLYAHGSTKPLLDLRAPVVFASADPEQHPVRYNEKPYRGRLEVFANTKGTLTVVNVVPLEEYVRGVVPNELSPGGWPELEALKAQAVAARTYAVSNLGRFAVRGLRSHARHALAGLRRTLDRAPAHRPRRA